MVTSYHKAIKHGDRQNTKEKMMDFLDMFTDQNQFKSENFEEDNLIRKVLNDGDNTFRVVGRGRIYYTHNFDSKNGVGVRSICTKDEDGNGECPVCKVWSGAWKVLNAVKKAEEKQESHNFTDEQVRMARIITGDSVNPRMNFKQSWGAKKNIALNVIDRNSDINSKEKHLSLLTKTEYEKGISAGRRGIYETLVKLLSRHKDELNKHYSQGHDWLPFDTVLIKSGKGIDTDYDKEKGNVSPLTKEELEWERYNLAEIVKPTDTALVTKWLESGTKGDAKAEKKEEPKQQEDSTDVMPPKEEQPKEETPAEEPKKKSGFTKKEPKEEPKPEKQDEVEMDNCPTCDKLIDVNSSKCPHCGEEFEGYDSETTPF